MSDTPKSDLVHVLPPANSPGQRKMPLGRPFPKGVSGNPNGKSREDELVRAWCRKKGLEAAKVLYELMQNGQGKVRLMAALALLDRGLGKPVATVDAGGSRAVGAIIILPPEGGDEG